MKQKQYRPSFTEVQCKILLDHTSSLETAEGRKLHRYFSRFCRDIETDWKQPAYISSPKMSVEEALGLETEIDSRTEIETEKRKVAIHSKRELATLKYESAPESCTKDELEDVYNFKLIHGFKDKEEEARLENILFGGF